MPLVKQLAVTLKVQVKRSMEDEQRGAEYRNAPRLSMEVAAAESLDISLSKKALQALKT